MKKNDGGPAFPAEADGGCGPSTGMSMLDYFAAAALQGICASDCYDDLTYEKAARTALEQSEAMLAERERRAGK